MVISLTDVMPSSTLVASLFELLRTLVHICMFLDDLCQRLDGRMVDFLASFLRVCTHETINYRRIEIYTNFIDTYKYRQTNQSRPDQLAKNR